MTIKSTTRVDQHALLAITISELAPLLVIFFPDEDIVILAFLTEIAHVHVLQRDFLLWLLTTSEAREHIGLVDVSGTLELLILLSTETNLS